MGKIVKMSFERKKTCKKWENGLKICDSEKKKKKKTFGLPGVGLLPPRGKIHVYYNDIQISSFLEPHGQPKSNSGEGEINVFMNNPGHIIKMAAMPIYGKNPFKFSGTLELILTKLGMKHRGLEYFNVFINYDIWITLTYFTARST